MTLIDLLPLIRGWTWRQETLIGTVLLKQELMIYQPPTPSKEVGWITALDFFGNDAYLGIRLVMPGVDTSYATFMGIVAIGGVLPPPAGSYSNLYWRPNPLRTKGQYGASIITSSYAWPFYGPARLYLSLRSGSTEPHATALITMTQVIVEDRNLFLKDLRKVLYGRWAPLMDLIGHIPILRSFVSKFEELGIPFEEKEIIEPPGIAR